MFQKEEKRIEFQNRKICRGEKEESLFKITSGIARELEKRRISLKISPISIPKYLLAGNRLLPIIAIGGMISPQRCLFAKANALQNSLANAKIPHAMQIAMQCNATYCALHF